MTAGLVSVVIPTFNRAYCLAATLDSVLAQTHSDIEVLLVDDGSTDQTRAQAEGLAAREPRLRYFYQTNRGVSAARNLGLQNARGDYIALLDSDDIWMPWKLEAQLACLAAFPDAGMIWTDMQAVAPDGRVLNPRFLRTMYDAYRWFTPEQLFSTARPFASMLQPVPEALRTAVARCGDVFSAMLMGNLVHTSTVLLRRERYEQVRSFDESMSTGEDYDFHLRTCAAGPVAFLDAASIRYQCGRPDQLTRNDMMIQVARNFLHTVTTAIAGNRQRITLPEWMIERSLADGHRWLGELALVSGQHAEAREHLAASLRLHPWQARTALLLASAIAPPAAGRMLLKGVRWMRGTPRAAGT